MLHLFLSVQTHVKRLCLISRRSDFGRGWKKSGAPPCISRTPSFHKGFFVPKTKQKQQSPRNPGYPEDLVIGHFSNNQ